MAGMPGIFCQPAFQALPDRITQVLDHLGRGHRRGEIRLHRTPPFLGTGHTIILLFSLQENVRSPPYQGEFQDVVAVMDDEVMGRFVNIAMMRNVSMLESPPFEILECASVLCLALTRLSFSASCFSLIILCIGHNPEN